MAKRPKSNNTVQSSSTKELSLSAWLENFWNNFRVTTLKFHREISPPTKTWRTAFIWSSSLGLDARSARYVSNSSPIFRNGQIKTIATTLNCSPAGRNTLYLDTFSILYLHCEEALCPVLTIYHSIQPRDLHIYSWRRLLDQNINAVKSVSSQGGSLLLWLTFCHSTVDSDSFHYTFFPLITRQADRQTGRLKTVLYSSFVVSHLWQINSQTDKGTRHTQKERKNGSQVNRPSKQVTNQSDRQKNKLTCIHKLLFTVQVTIHVHEGYNNSKHFFYSKNRAQEANNCCQARELCQCVLS